ncbi:MAG TPA: hypothetical protein VMD30_08665 [Tepidisphaeraceae bacterium]|nr:hypothetical protein [Tepidisphaeraceae bacterium]
MRLTLATRIGADTLGKLEQAARRRYAEAKQLVADEPLGAIYLFGYTVEMRLKVAYFRTVGLVTASALAPSRNYAEAQIRMLLGVRGAVGHNLYGWARLLETARATTPGAKVLPSGLAKDMYKHLQNVEACWTEVLRYRANKPYDDEVKAVRSGAAWFKVNGHRLWS